MPQKRWNRILKRAKSTYKQHKPMRYPTTLLLAGYCLLCACNKSTTIVPPNNTWTIGTHTYKAVTIRDTMANGLYALDAATGSDSAAHHLLVRFYGVSLPVSGGTYAVVPQPQGGNQMAIVAYNYDTVSHATTAYAVNGAGSVPTFAIVAIQAGKINLNLQAAAAVNVMNMSDSLQLGIHNLTQP